MLTCFYFYVSFLPILLTCRCGGLGCGGLGWVWSVGSGLPCGQVNKFSSSSNKATFVSFYNQNIEFQVDDIGDDDDDDVVEDNDNDNDDDDDDDSVGIDDGFVTARCSLKPLILSTIAS